jgi:hypothetical protein
MMRTAGALSANEHGMCARLTAPLQTMPLCNGPFRGTLTMVFPVRGRTAGWYPHSANVPGKQRAVYDPVSHATTLYSFRSDGGVDRKLGKGDKMLREKAQADLNEGSAMWHGRRKGVVEFVDRTHTYAVNANRDFLATCAANEFAYHQPKGELRHWMDIGISTRVQPPPFKNA